MTHNQNIQNLRTAVKGEEVRTSMIELFEEDYGLVGKAIQTGTAVTGESSTDPTTGYYDGNLYINTSTLQIFKFDGTYWNEIAIIRNIENIEGTNPTADGAINTITVYYNDDTTDTFQIKNGSTGTAGVSVTGVHDNGDGTFYLTLSDGTTTGNIATVKGDTGATGPAGPTGATGAKGRDITSITGTKTGKVTSFTATYSDGSTQLIGNVTDGADGTGGGDMYQATYDTNSNGIVDLAEGLSDGTNTMPYSTVANKADKATTLGGYGITDAYTKAEVDAAIAGSTSGGYIQSVSNDFTVSSNKLFLSTATVNKIDMLNNLPHGTDLNEKINEKADEDEIDAIKSGIGTVITKDSGTVSLPNKAYTEITKATLTKGVWYVGERAQWTKNSAYDLRACISGNSADGSALAATTLYDRPTSNTEQSTDACFGGVIVVTSESKTVYCNMYQGNNESKSINVRVWLSATKIANL